MADPITDPVPVERRVDLGLARLLPDLDRPRGWLLTLDDAPQSYVDLDDPLYLEFEYVQRLAHAADLAAASGEPIDVLHLGGGALTLARYLAATRPGSRQQAVEIDAGLSALVGEYLPWSGASGSGSGPGAGSASGAVPGAGLRVHAADARQFLAAAPEDSADLVVADVFGGSRIPAHLTSVEFVREAARVLRPGGLYAANLADGAPLDFARGQLATVRAVFAEVCLVAEPSVLRGRRYGNLVLLAADHELPAAELARRTAADPFPARVVHGDRLELLTGRARPVTDATAAPSPPPPEGAFAL
ncbi:spermidine synthase-like protein [Streptacidiphilus sp. PB12-B1b]|uniref:spermidine synthase n=1 Tax=Streptacidiphilus sp. PB12-B1b TaxID=2705012 RepID=UPI001CDC83B3|nr:fused MFS/spermidine synthase [Streptacidiphilus sp. PB12-B1b]QMU76530.1 spermidine synthase-like protein [Streptacidiphilus sp. PB12-B1b]